MSAHKLFILIRLIRICKKNQIKDYLYCIGGENIMVISLTKSELKDAGIIHAMQIK